MDNDLKTIFYNPKTGFTGVNRLIQIAKENGLKYSNKEIRDWYNQQAVNQIYHQPTNVKKFNSIQAVNYQPGTVQIDLIDIQKYSHWNKGYHYILTAVDVHSRFAWAFMIKTKEAKDVAPHIETIMKKITDVLEARGKTAEFYFTSDRGSEFKADVEKMFQKKGVNYYKSDPQSLNSHRTTGIIERFNRTLRNYLKKYMLANDTVIFVDVLDQLIENYNNRVHSTTGRTPKEILEKNKTWIKRIDETDLKTYDSELKIGNFVRFQVKQNIYSKKGWKNRYSYTVHKIVAKKDNLFLLDNDKTFYEDQLILAKEGEDKSEVKRKFKQVDKKAKQERENLAEFGVKDISQFVVEGKREKKPNKKYIDDNAEIKPVKKETKPMKKETKPVKKERDNNEVNPGIAKKERDNNEVEGKRERKPVQRYIEKY